MPVASSERIGINYVDPGPVDSCEAYDVYEYGDWQPNYVPNWRGIAEGICRVGAAEGAYQIRTAVGNTPAGAIASAVSLLLSWAACDSIDVTHTGAELFYIQAGEKRKVWHYWGERLPSGQCRINQESWWEYRHE